MKEDLLLRWLTTDPEAYDRMVGDHQMAAYVATIDAPLLAACQGRVLELACGTGRLLRLLDARPEVQQVVGLDIAPRMLAAAAARGHRLLVQASAEALPFSAGRFDTILCAVYTLRDLERSKVYTEVARVLGPGASWPSPSGATTQRISRRCGGSFCVKDAVHARGGISTGPMALNGISRT